MFGLTSAAVFSKHFALEQVEIASPDVPQLNPRRIFLLFYSEYDNIDSTSRESCQNLERIYLPTMPALLRILGFVAYLIIQSVCVFSFPRPGLLNPRQSSCDTLVCPPSLDNFMGGAGDFFDDFLNVGAGVAGWVIDKATGLLVPQPVEGQKPNNANAPVADPMGQQEILGIPQDQCTAVSGSNPNDGSGQVGHHVWIASCTTHKHMLTPGPVIVRYLSTRSLVSLPHFSLCGH